MDWPFIENTNNFIVDFHLVYAGVLVYLIVKRAGHSGYVRSDPNASRPRTNPKIQERLAELQNEIVKESTA